MSQLSLTQSFDTSLLDVTTVQTRHETLVDSFSSCTTTSQSNSFSSESGSRPKVPMAAPTTNRDARPKEVTHVPNTTAYNLWAPTYDTDGNMLVSLDTMQLSSHLLSEFLHALADIYPAQPLSTDEKTPLSTLEPLHIVDLGSGTGRATLLLLAALQDPRNASAVARLIWPSTPASSPAQHKPRPIHITSLDSSSGMLAIARTRVPSSIDYPAPPPPSSSSSVAPPATVHVEVTFALHDVLAAPPAHIRRAHAVLSTLVLEHVPLAVFFEHVAALLAGPESARGGDAGGVALVTNMHPDMGNHGSGAAVGGAPAQGGADDPQPPTAAGFTDTATGVKIRGKSYAHSVEGTVQAARAVGLCALGAGDAVEEVAVTEEMVRNAVVGERGVKWIGVRCWLGGVFALRGRTESAE